MRSTVSVLLVCVNHPSTSFVIRVRRMLESQPVDYELCLRVKPKYVLISASDLRTTVDVKTPVWFLRS